MILVCQGIRVRWVRWARRPYHIVDLGGERQGKPARGAEIRTVLGDLHRTQSAAPPRSGWGRWGYGAHALGQNSSAHSSTAASRHDLARLSWAQKTPSC